MPSTQLFPEVIDGTTLNERISGGLYLPIGIEGGIDAAGSANINQLYKVTRPADADTWFGPVSSLATHVKYLLDQGAGPIYAVPSKKTTAPILAERQVAWQLLEAQRPVRIRLTDSVLDADLAALAVSCKNADLLNNKQFMIGGKALASTKANLITAAGLIRGDLVAAKRAVLTGPGVYDASGVLKTGAFAADAIAAMVAQNSDPADDLDTATVPNLTGMEKDASGNDLFRMLVVAGTVVNDFEDLLQAGVSPLMPAISGSGVAISHLRTTSTADSTYDSLMTRIIVDQVFTLVRDYCINFNQLRKGNTPKTRAGLKSAVDALLKTLSDWIQPVTMGDGSTGYDVTVSASADQRQQIVSYRGAVVRGVSTIVVAGNLTIAA